MSKPFWQSRMLWVNAAVLIGPCLPFIHGWIVRDPVHVMQFHALYNLVLRLDTRHELTRGKET